jgi:hypothetical protein
MSGDGRAAQTPVGDAALEIIRERHRSGTSFPELAAALRERGYEPVGGTTLLFTMNVVLWTGMSEQLAAALDHMLGAGTAHLHALLSKTARLTVYGRDGRALPLPPVTRKPPAGGYKHAPHWLAAVWHPGTEYRAAGRLEPRPAWLDKYRNRERAS